MKKIFFVLLFFIFIPNVFANPFDEFQKEYTPIMQYTVFLHMVGGFESACTGVVIHPQVILTAKHCIEESDPITVLINEKYSSTRWVLSKDYDLALIYLEDHSFKNSARLSYINSKVDDLLMGFSVPNNSVMVLLFKVAKSYKYSYLLHGKSLPGTSGSGIFNENHELVAILNGHFVNNETFTIVTSVEAIKKFLLENNISY